jgi:hypothetical protein
VESFYEMTNGHYLGWQYQDGLFQLGVALDPKRKTFLGKRLLREQTVLDQYANWCEASNLPESLGVGSMRPGPKVSKVEHQKYSGTGLSEGGAWAFNSYEPDFVYRSTKISTLTLGQLKDANRTLMTKAAQLDSVH